MITIDNIIMLADAGEISAMVKAIQYFVWETDPALSENPAVREKIMNYLSMAIKSGNADAMNQLGAMYAEGKWVEQDLEKSFLCYKDGAVHGSSLAMSNLGFCYLYGNGTDIDYEAAYKTFSKAATLGVGDAIVRLGDMYNKGLFVEEDPETALKMYKKALTKSADKLDELEGLQVYSDATLRIGEFYELGRVVEADRYAALKYYADALYYYWQRQKLGDYYSESGYRKALEKVAEISKDFAM